MEYIFKPKKEFERFGVNIYNLLVDNFPRTYLTGGTVRDFLLHQPIKDFDITTIARPQEVMNVLKKHCIEFNASFKNFGVVVAISKAYKVAIATFRKDLPSDSRYNKVMLTNSAKIDSQRRDFTINALYLSLKTNKILDFHSGIQDLQKKKIMFIGDPQKRISQDPLRIIRSMRFALNFKFKIEKNSFSAIKSNFNLISKLSKSRIETEIKKIKQLSQEKIILECIRNQRNLDKYF